MVSSLQRLCLIASLIGSGSSLVAKAQTSDIDSELAQAKKELELATLKANVAEQQKKEAEYQQAISGIGSNAELKGKSDLSDYQKKEADLLLAQATTIKAYAPDFAKVTPPSGNMTVTGQFAETDRLIYKSLAGSVVKIANALKAESSALGKRFMVFDNATVNQVMLYSYVNSKLVSAKAAMITADASANKLITDIRNPAPAGQAQYKLAGAGALLAAGTALQSVANAAQLFKSDKQITNSSMEIPKPRLIALLQQSYPGVILSCPEIMPIGLLNVTDPIIITTQEMANEALTMADTNRGIDALIVEQNVIVKKTKKELAGNSLTATSRTSKTKLLATTNHNVRELQSAKESLAYWINAQKEIDKVMGAAIGLDGNSFLFSLVKAGRVHQQLGSDSTKSKLMLLSTDCKGSEIITKSVWTNARLKHSASSSMTCTVFDPKGFVLFSQTADSYVLPTKHNKVN